MSNYTPTLTEQVTNRAVKWVTSALCRVDAGQLARIPTQGPLIIVTNHINFLEAPVIYTRLVPRPVTGFAKTETWDSAFLGWLFDMWGIIPIRRGEPDKTALKRGVQALKDGYILTIAPEGTRSHDGRLLRGFPGITMVALLSGAPLLPVAHYGHENYRQDLRRLRRTNFHVHVGRIFTLNSHGEKTTSEVRQRMTDEIMYQLAALLPPAYRGAYADFSMASTKYLVFSEGGNNDLPPDAQGHP
jgi:1-acyl-sn-glycerol-3-phosphate acyltransferase